MEEYLFVISFQRLGAYLPAPAGPSAAVKTAMLIFNLFTAMHYNTSTVPKMSILPKAATVLSHGFPYQLILKLTGC
jgi:hypothetical protein